MYSSTGRRRKNEVCLPLRHVKHLKQLCGLPRSIPTHGVLPVGIGLAFFACRAAACNSASALGTSCWHYLLMTCTGMCCSTAPLMGSDSPSTRMQQACNAPGSTLNRYIDPAWWWCGGLAAAPLGTLQLRRLDSSAIMQQRHEQQEQRLEAAALDPAHPREPPPKSIGACSDAAIHSGWCRSDTYSSSLLLIPAPARKINLILRFRLGCLRQLPVVQGQNDNIPRT